MLLVLLLVFLIAAFSATGLMVGAPYLPTLKRQVETALDLANLKKGQTLLELGCGDGRMLIAAARRDIKTIGYEINPILFIVARLRTRKYRSLVRVVWGNYWRLEWPKADCIFVFLIGRYMSRLDKQIMAYKTRPLKLVSFAFTIPGKKATASRDGVHLYHY